MEYLYHVDVLYTTICVYMTFMLSCEDARAAEGLKITGGSSAWPLAPSKGECFLIQLYSSSSSSGSRMVARMLTGLELGKSTCTLYYFMVGCIQNRTRDKNIELTV